MNFPESEWPGVGSLKCGCALVITFWTFGLSVWHLSDEGIFVLPSTQTRDQTICLSIVTCFKGLFLISIDYSIFETLDVRRIKKTDKTIHFLFVLSVSRLKMSSFTRWKTDPMAQRAKNFIRKCFYIFTFQFFIELFCFYSRKYLLHSSPYFRTLRPWEYLWCEISVLCSKKYFPYFCFISVFGGALHKSRASCTWQWKFDQANKPSKALLVIENWSITYDGRPTPIYFTLQPYVCKCSA